jgi:hypothetical protein
MPNDFIVDPANYHRNWDTVKDAINLAHREIQGGEDVWCVVSFDGAYMGTVWSQPRVHNGPTNHAEDRFFGVYSDFMIRSFREKFGRHPDVLRLSLKYSPCNKSNDKYDRRCTFKIADATDYWPLIQVRYKRPYTNPDHDMAHADHVLNGPKMSSGQMY